MNEGKNTSLISFLKNDDRLYAFVRGEIDHHSAKLLRDGIDEKIFEVRPKSLYIDLSEVEFMDSSGLGLLMGRYKLMRVYGGKTYIQNPSHRVLKIIELAQMGRIIEVIEEEKIKPTQTEV